ncbi:MAG: zinc-ribbon domain-containing protein [Bacteroidales bacterium]|nr:zinc-ribbon domain-containing protein [Bacteroidales bacterium]
MAYCTHCGASLPDGARFCPVCGKAVATVSARTSADGRGIIIDAPKGSTVTVDAPDLKGEFTLSEWDEPVADPKQTSQPAAIPAKQPSGKKGKKKRSLFVRVIRFIFGMIITVIILLFLYWFYQGYTSV